MDTLAIYLQKIREFILMLGFTWIYLNYAVKYIAEEKHIRAIAFGALTSFATGWNAIAVILSPYIIIANNKRRMKKNTAAK